MSIFFVKPNNYGKKKPPEILNIKPILIKPTGAKWSEASGKRLLELIYVQGRKKKPTGSK